MFNAKQGETTVLETFARWKEDVEVMDEEAPKLAKRGPYKKKLVANAD